MTEKREAVMLVTKGGSGSSTFRATLPTKWVREMGLSESDRDLLLSFDGEKIIIENNCIAKFFECETHQVDMGYIIHYTNDPCFPTHAVVEDADGHMEMVNIEDEDWEDLDDFLDLIIRKYEGR